MTEVDKLVPNRMIYSAMIRGYGYSHQTEKVVRKKFFPIFLRTDEIVERYGR
jgi:hypothetical protein